MDLNIKLIIIIMENMATTTYDLSQVITKENIINADDKQAFFDEHKLKLKTYLGTTGLQYNIIQYQKEWLVDELINTTGQFRSVIFDNSSLISVKHLEPGPCPRITIDGRARFASEDNFPIEITVADRSLRLMQNLDYSHFAIVRDKLNWGDPTIRQ